MIWILVGNVLYLSYYNQFFQMLYGTKLRDNDYRLKAFRFIRRDVSNGYSYNIKLRIGCYQAFIG